MHARTLLALCTTLKSLAATSAAELVQAPTIIVDDAIVVGTTDGATTSFLGIPFAQPPCVSRRSHNVVAQANLTFSVL